MYQMNIDGNKVNLCIDCQLKMEQIRARQNEESERLINYLSDHMASLAGLPPTGPRFPQRTSIKAEGAVLNNIHVTDSQIGVINTGTVQTIDAAVTNIRDGGDAELSQALTELTQAIIGDTDLAGDKRQEALDLIETVSAEAAQPQEKRRKAVIRPLIKEVGQILQGSAAATVIFEKVLPVLETLF